SVRENDYAWRQRLSKHNIKLTDACSIGQGSLPHFLLALIFAMVDFDTRSAALKMCTGLCDDRPENAGAPDLRAIAERAIELYLEKNHGALGTFAENVLPYILDKQDSLAAFAQRRASTCHNSPSRMALFLAVLKAGRA